MIDLRALLASGELHRIAQQCRDQKEFADRLGVTPGAYRSKVARLRHGGVSFPTYEQLRGHESSHVHDAELGARLDLAATPAGQARARELLESRSLSSDFADEEPTQPGYPQSEYREIDTGIEKSIRPPLPPMTPGFHIKRKSTLVDGATGTTKQQWIIEEQTAKQRMEALLQALPSIVEPFAGMAEPIRPPQYADEDLMAVYILGDPHLGLQTWAEECGENFDLQIAEHELVTAFRHLVGVAPPAKRAAILNLGDFLHFDNESISTTKGTRQDGDTRWPKVMRASIRSTRTMTDLALGKHQDVDDFIIPGNHDKHSAYATALAVEQFYANEPRVTVDTSPDPFKWIEFGKVLIMACHGEEAKAERLMGVMATDRPEAWGRTLYRYIHTGHVHHSSMKELPGCIHETFPTLAPKDRYHHGAGYRAQQTMCVDTYHREFGRINRSIVGVRQLRAKQSA